MPLKTDLPPLPWTGGCQCGQVSYKLNAYPQTIYCCHCTECQRQASSMHGISVLIPFNALEIQGELAVWSRKTDSGNTTDCHFCPQCGVRIYHRGTHRTSADAIVSLKGGTLDQMQLLEPVGHIWMQSSQAGFRADALALQFERQPETYDDLMKAWHERHFHE